MTRAPSVCSVPGCPAIATDHGRCATHAATRNRWANGTPGYRDTGWNRAADRARILARDGWRCYICGRQAVTVDHVVPRSAGGPDTDANKRGICTPCHRAKTAREAAQARRRVA